MYLRNDTIFVISPGYFDAIKSCITKFQNFELQMYDTAEEALYGLDRTPSYSYLGFCYINSGIEEDDFDYLRTILNKINIMYLDLVDPEIAESRIPFLFIISSKEGKHLGSFSRLRQLLSDLDLFNISLLYYDYSIMTDTIIKGQMIGTILLNNRKFEVSEQQRTITSNRMDSVILKFPFEDKFIELFDSLSYIEVDEFIKKYSRIDPLLVDIRKFMYLKSEDLLDSINSRIQQIPLDLRVFYETCMRNLNLIGGDFSEQN